MATENVDISFEICDFVSGAKKSDQKHWKSVGARISGRKSIVLIDTFERVQIVVGVYPSTDRGEASTPGVRLVLIIIRS